MQPPGYYSTDSHLERHVKAQKTAKTGPLFNHVYCVNKLAMVNGLAYGMQEHESK